MSDRDSLFCESETVAVSEAVKDAVRVRLLERELDAERLRVSELESDPAVSDPVEVPDNV